MFDIGFAELLVIAVVALLVIGPERLPRVARTAGMWLGRARRFVSSVKADIDRELAADELKKALSKQSESQSLYDIVEDTRNSLDPQAGAASAEKNKDNTAVADKSHDTDG
jgi:sec-independent protein translocase protein TatB